MKRIYVDWNTLDENERVYLNTTIPWNSVEAIGELYPGMRMLADDSEVQFEIVVEMEDGVWFGRLDSQPHYLDEKIDQ